MKTPDLSAYPVAEAADAVRSALARHKRAVLSSPTGSGKSTVLPLLLPFVGLSGLVLGC